MSYLNRRRFVGLASMTAASITLAACGNKPLTKDEINPTQIPDVPGAPPTLAPITGTPGAGGAASDGASGGSGGALTIEAKDNFSYTPNELSVYPGQKIPFKNAGFMQHDLAVDAWGGELTGGLVNGGETKEITIPADAKVGDKQEFYCTVPGHKEGGMKGTFTVVEKGKETQGGSGSGAAQNNQAASGTGNAAAGGTVEIKTNDNFTFDPKELTVAPGQKVKVTNAGFMQHDLSVDAWGGPQTKMLGNGESQEITIPADAKKGDKVEFYCSVPGHKEGGMKGTFTIGDAAASAPASGAATSDQSAGTPAANAESSPAAASGAGATGGTVEIKASDDFKFTPNEVTVSPGQKVKLTNAGFMQHDLSVDAWGGPLTKQLANGASEEFTVPADAKVGDKVEFYCSVPGHKEAGMKGTFTIAEASAAAAPAGGDTGTPAAASGAGASGGTIDIKASDDFKFTPNTATVSPGQKVKLTNGGFMQHDLSVDAWGGPQTKMLNNGESAEFTVPADAKVGDKVEFYCSVPGHKEAGMKGTFTIAAGSGATSGAAASSTPAAGGSAAPTGPAVIKTLDTMKFDPAKMDVTPGQKITVENHGYMQHDLNVDAWGGEMVPLLNNGEKKDFTVPADAKPGETFEYYCSVAGHRQAGMVGTFTVVAGSGNTGTAAPAASAATPSAAASPVAQAKFTGNVINVAVTEWEYNPKTFEVAPGDKIVLTNNGVMAHDMSSAEWGDKFIPDVAKGQTGEFVIPADAKVGTQVKIYSFNQGATKLGMAATAKIVEKTSPSATPVPSPVAALNPTPAASPAAGSTSGGKKTEVKMLDTLHFDPAEVTVSAGDVITFHNTGFMQHDAKSDELGQLVDLVDPAKSKEWTVPSSVQSGKSYEFYCTVPGHKEGGMVGKLTIK